MLPSRVHLTTGRNEVNFSREIRGRTSRGSRSRARTCSWRCRLSPPRTRRASSGRCGSSLGVRVAGHRFHFGRALSRRRVGAIVANRKLRRAAAPLPDPLPIGCGEGEESACSSGSISWRLLRPFASRQLRVESRWLRMEKTPDSDELCPSAFHDCLESFEDSPGSFENCPR